jgi:hypothetical protein
MSDHPVLSVVLVAVLVLCVGWAILHPSVLIP